MWEVVPKQIILEAKQTLSQLAQQKYSRGWSLEEQRIETNKQKNKFRQKDFSLTWMRKVYLCLEVRMASFASEMLMNSLAISPSRAAFSVPKISSWTRSGPDWLSVNFTHFLLFWGKERQKTTQCICSETEQTHHVDEGFGLLSQTTMQAKRWGTLTSTTSSCHS